MINLHLGSGTTRLGSEWINVDLYSKHADLKHDLTTRLPYDDGTVDQIYSSHFIEHLSRTEWEFARQDWLRVLKPGGTIELHCPNMTEIAKRFLSDNTYLLNIYGDQSDEGQFHKNGFTAQLLQEQFKPLNVKIISSTNSLDLHAVITK